MAVVKLDKIEKEKSVKVSAGNNSYDKEIDSIHIILRKQMNYRLALLGTLIVGKQLFQCLYRSTIKSSKLASVTVEKKEGALNTITIYKLVDLPYL